MLNVGFKDVAVQSDMLWINYT